ncbi:MAG: hypothetical protein IPK60_20435 [Sandaracinaceae bacterium]|nr:hypothetical protein [Sandaracinaceae bacterium]
MRLIRADIERVRRGRAAHSAGDRGPRGHGGARSYANWHIAAVMDLNGAGAEQVLTDLLPRAGIPRRGCRDGARDFVPKLERIFDRTFRYDLMWAAREGSTPPPGDNQRRTRFAATLDAEIGARAEPEGNPAKG